MPLKIITGDILEQKSDILVMPAAPRKGPSSEFAENIYNAAGYDDMQKARKKIGHLPAGEAAVTPGFNLTAKYVIHVFTPEWFGGFMNEPEFLANCYCNAIKSAVKLNAKSISFPLLGSGTNRVPPDVAEKIAVHAICNCLRTHSYSINVYLVICPGTAKALSECDIALPEEKKQFHKSRFIKYMNDNIPNITKFANYIGCNKSTVNRIMNGNTECPQKSTVLLIAIGLQLSKEERYDFINCSGNPYPVDERDYKLEELLDSGYTNIDDINILLYQQNPEWELRHKCRGDMISESKKKTNP